MKIPIRRLTLRQKRRRDRLVRQMVVKQYELGRKFTKEEKEEFLAPEKYLSKEELEKARKQEIEFQFVTQPIRRYRRLEKKKKEEKRIEKKIDKERQKILDRQKQLRKNHGIRIIKEKILANKENIKLIDDLVKEYKNGNKSAAHDIIKLFESYFRKYTALLVGKPAKNLMTRDTVLFLRLFGKDKDLEAIRKKIIYTMREYFGRDEGGWTDEEDVFNNIIIIFYKVLDGYKKVEEVHFLHYFTLVFRFKLNNWILKISKDPLTFAYSNQSNDLGLKEEDRVQEATFFDGMSEIDLSWIYKSKDPLFSHLSPSDRYLLVEKIGKGKPLREVAKSIGRSKDLVRDRLDKIMTSLREKIDAIESG